jgi:CubicO group peptidase (beta-lactamase class C family)
MTRSVTLRRLVLLPAFLLSAAAPVVHAQTAAPAAPVASVATGIVVDPALAGIDSALTAMYPAGEPGAAVLVARDGRVLMRKAYGAANVELNVPLRPEHVFRLGSITKQFTAVATLMLVDEGKVSLDDEITRWFPDYPTQGRRITVEHLLTHTSGIRSYTSIPEFRAGIRRDLSVNELMATFRDQPMEFEPGARFSYNNSGYALLGAIIEKASGLNYADFVRTRIFQPLGMRSTFYETAQTVVPGRVDGYDRMPDGTVRRAEWISMTQPYAAGSLISTVDDLLLWNRAVAEGRILKPETWRRAFAAYTMNDGLSSGYGYGWFIGEAAGRPSIEHGGDIHGFSTDGLWIPSERLHVIVLANHRREPQRNPGDISQRIATALLGEPAAPAVALTPEQLDAYVGVYRISETDSRVITREGGTLYSQRGRNPRQALTPLGDDQFVYANTGTRARFVRGADGAVTGMRMKQRLGPEELSPRTAHTVEQVAAAAATVRVPVEVLDRYVGRYELSPEMTVTMRRVGEALLAQPSGDDEVTLVPESETRFTVPEDDIAVVFQVDAAGVVTGFVLHQNGRQMTVRKLP